jgi:hypothetical protein
VREVCPQWPGDPETIHWSTADPAAGTDGDDGRPVGQLLDNQLRSLLVHADGVQGNAIVRQQ